MKIALCLSGGPRFQHRGLFKLLDAMKGFDHADFFIRTWKTNEFGNTAKEFESYLRNNGISDKFNFAVTQVLDDSLQNHPPHIPLNIAHWAPNFLTMWWGVVQCNQLRKQYQQETGVKYDLVFRMRTDMIPNGDIDLKQYVDSAQTKMYNANNFGDNFLFGGESMYDRFVEYWNHLSILSANQTFIHPEQSLEDYFKITGIPYECLPVLVQPQHDPSEYKVRNH
jgi:hypothetical protein